MQARFVVLLGAIAVLAACDKSTTPVSPATTTDDVVDLIPDYAVSPAASIDAAGIGGSLLPDALKLTPEQKAAITALHEAFMAANAAAISIQYINRPPIRLPNILVSLGNTNSVMVTDDSLAVFEN